MYSILTLFVFSVVTILDTDMKKPLRGQKIWRVTWANARSKNVTVTVHVHGIASS